MELAGRSGAPGAGVRLSTAASARQAVGSTACIPRPSICVHLRHLRMILGRGLSEPVFNLRPSAQSADCSTWIVTCASI